MVNINCIKLLRIIVFFLMLVPSILLAEGTKELWIGNYRTGLFLCNDLVTHCDIPPPYSLGNRTDFAVYNCDEEDRLYFETYTPDEVVYLGFQGGFTGDDKIVYRIKKQDGTIVQAEQDLPTSGTGFINTVQEARVGPIQLYGANGYNAIVLSPAEAGTFYIEFNMVTDDPSPQTSLGMFTLDLIDITVVDDPTSTVRPGRLHSKAWQLDTPVSAHCSGAFFVYSNDSIITSLSLNDFNGGVWLLCCNQTGVSNTGNWIQDRKSVADMQVYVPQYRIFLNEPDSNLFPPASNLGSIVAPQPWGETFCNDGSIMFHVNVDVAGDVEIMLDFPDPYVDRSLPENVSVGENLITWDGLDREGIQVPHNTSVDFFVSYINGLTNLPLYDIEGNENGFDIDIVSPQSLSGQPPLVFWDDSNIPNGTINLTGCQSPPGCHVWENSDYGNANTINTWWYNVSSISNLDNITLERMPQSLQWEPLPATSYCAGETAIFNVTSDPNTDLYSWNYTGNDVIITTNNNSATLFFGTNATSGSLEVFGTNSCGNGDTLFLVIGIQELPYVSAGLDYTIYDNQTITLVGDTLHSTAAIWTTSGDGVFSDATILTPLYTPGITDIANGSVELMLEANAVAPCTDHIQDTMVLTILPLAGADDFITTWQTTTPNESITIPTTGGGYNYDVDWGDGNITTGHNGNATHSYTTAGIYTVTISGDFPRIYFNNTGDKDKIVSIEQWGTGIWISMQNAFYGCVNLIGNAMDTPDLSVVIDMSQMFRNANLYNGDLSNWDVSNVINMGNMFSGASSFNRDISNWDVSNVTDMIAMFDSAILFNCDLNNWDVGNITSMWCMFRSAYSFNGDISSWNVSNVTLMVHMFAYANSFNGDLSNWDVSNVDDMWGMFKNAISFDQNIGNWNVQAVLEMTDMFIGVTLSTSNYDALLIGWDTQNLQSGINFHGGNSLYCAGEAARTNMINNDGWTITDGGKDPVCTGGNEAGTWYFGQNAGLDFSGGDPVAVTDGQLVTNEGCATISDSDGNLLFYTDGMSVWNKNHEVMNNGIGLLGHYSSTQSAVIVPKPGSDSLYYIFTVPAEEIDDGYLYYSIVDMSLIGGLGRVISKNVFLWEPVVEKITAVVHENGTDIWVVTHERLSNAFCSFLVSSSGVNHTPVTSDVGTVYTLPVSNYIGYIKASTSGSYIACAIYEPINLVELFDFNNTTGSLSNPITITGYVEPYAIEFSPDESRLYCGMDDDIYQFDLTAGTPTDIINSGININATSPDLGGALQIGPNQKIYRTYQYCDYLGVINNPNELGVDCNYDPNGVYLDGKKGIFGLPTFIQSFFSASISYENVCFGDSTFFEMNSSDPIQSITWDFGDPASGSNNTSTLLNPGHIFTTSGNFTVTANIILTDGSTEVSSIVITIYDIPLVNIGNDTLMCEGDILILDAGPNYQYYQWSTGETTQTIEVSSTGIYDVIVSTDYCSSFDTITVNVADLPTAGFLYQPSDSLCVNELISFTDNSTSNINSWNWDFDDGNSSTIQNPTHSYSSMGNYNVQLTVSDNNTCVNSLSTTILINELPNPDFNILPNDTVCAKQLITFDGFDNAGTTITDWYWDYGDGFTGSGQSPSHIYTASGNYTITLNVINNNSCSSIVTKLVHIRSLPESDFTISPNDTTCVGEIVNLNATDITGDITTWNWQFGDGNTAAGQTTSHTYISLISQDYNILSIYQNTSGCIDTTIHQRHVKKVVLDFSITDNPTCQNYPVIFESTADKVTFTPYNWIFGDGSGDVGFDVSHIYTTPDTVNVQLNVCSEQVSQQLIINPTCDVDAGGLQRTCQDVYFNYANSLTPPTADGYSSIQWYTTGLGTFNDATLITPTYFPHPSEGVTQNDTIIMTMIGYGQLPCSNDTSMVELIVIPGAYAFAGSDESSCFGVPYDFVNSIDSAFATHYTTLFWSTSGTGSFVDPNVQQPIYVPGPNEIGQVTLTMVASNIINCDSIDEMVLTIRPTYEVPIDITLCYYDSVYAQGAWRYSSGIFFDTLLSQYSCDSVIVTNLIVRDKIDKDFTISTGDSICLGESTTFTQTGNANLNTWQWDFGDGNISTQVNPTHSYISSGIYNVKLSYYDENGCFDSIVKQVNVFDLPDASFTISATQVCVNTQVQLDGSSNSNIVDWHWDFGDGTTANGQSVVHSFTTWGLLNIVLTVTDNNGCSYSVLDIINIAQPPEANFTYDIVVCDSLQFYDLSIAPSGYNLVQWFWDFGDGLGTSNLQNPTYQYASNTTPGGEVYQVTLTVMADSSGFICSDSIVLPVTVPSLPDIFFTYMPDPTCLGDSTYFCGESGFPIDVWHWDFDDGNVSNDQYASHMYTLEGDYNVVLTITDTNLCQNTLTNVITVSPVPTVSFSMSDTTACHGTEIQFTSTNSTNVETWYWDFGDGSFSLEDDPIHYFPQGGTYTVTLTVTDSAGCEAEASNQVLILPGATADFTYQNLTCSSVLFNDLSIAPPGYFITNWLWDFGDGFTANVQNPSHSYVTGIGVYDVTLIVTADSSGYSCNDTIVQTIYTPGLPTVFFTWNPEPTMLGNQTDFFGTSGNQITDWYWDFDDGNFATTQDATNTFATVGTFDVELTVTDIDGCQNTILHTVSVTNVPELDYTWNYSCMGEPIQFTVESPPTDIPAVVSWDWDFGDGGISTEMNPLHVYPVAGTYNVSLTIVDTMAATNTIIKQIVVNPLPVALFSIDPLTCAMNDVQFHDLSTTPTGFITQWHWEFGDGNTQTVNFPNDPDVIYQYAAIGTYTVSLTITNSDSCENTTTNDITITASPTAMFTHSEGCESNPFTFTDTSIENGGGIILQWNWDFGDPASGTDNTSTLQNPVHMFSAAGSYDVELMIMNSNGCTDTTTMTVTVEEDPEVEFSWTANCQGEETLFEVDETITNVTEVETFAWTFGDGGTSNLQNPTHIYTVAGDYTVTLMITTTAQCMASVTHTVPINPLPTANFDHDAPACLNQEVEFTDLSSSQNGLIETWEWDFGDGNITTITAPDNPDVTHLYGSDGNYDVMLTVTDGEGCINEVTKNVEVVSNPIADFNYDETCYNEPVYFTDMSTENGGPDIQSWEWFFGDPASGTNNNSNLQNPTHVFTAPGVYTTTLIIISTMGCSDTTEQDITVDELPLASIGVLDDSICLGQLAEFTGTGTNISTWYWEFGDGGTSIDQNPSYMYQSPGEYIVTLTVTGIGTEQCTFTTDTTITVNGAPEAMFEYENTCLGDSTYFTDLSYSQYGFVSQWDWDFGDGNTSTMEDPSHYYQNNDDYEVTLIVTDNYGCSDTIALWVQVYDSPNPSFTWDQVCDPVGQVNYFDESTPGTDGAPIVGWSWELDDGYFSSEIDPSYIYNIIDTCYTVLLTVTDNNGCESTDTNTQVCLHGELEIDFTTTTVCQNQETTFTAIYGPQSDSVASYTWNFNDGSPIEITYYDTIAHIFPQPGMYIVELTAVDTNDCIATIYKEVTVDSLPTAQFTNTIGNCATATEFTDISLGGGEFIQIWLWNFGDIASPDNTSTLQNPTHLYGPNDSIYTVKLIVTNFNGCIDSIEQDVYVEPCVVANFELPVGNNCARTELCFTDTSNITSNNNAIDQWRWEFGDGETYNYGDHQNPICHTYEDAGDYDVQLIVVATINGTTYQDTMIRTLTVNPTPLAEIGVTNNCLNDTTRFYDNSTTFGAPILTYEWTFGDETTANDTSSKQDPKYKYPSYGDYITQLIVDNEYGCIDTITDTITVFKLPEAEFSFEELCMSYYTYFTDESIGDSSDIANYNWTFDINQHDTNTSIELSPVNIYDTAGIYYPRLIVMDENMCKDSIDKVVDIKPIPTSNFMIIDTIQQGNIYLQNLSQDVTGLQDGLTYYWDFDYDYGESSTEVSPTHQYEVDGNYDVMLVSYNEFNCPDTMHQIYNLLFTNLFVPNAFSPSSALTDLQIFKPTGINIKSYRLEVYSAWGNLVFESTKLDNGAPMEGWDGTYKNKDLPTGSYIWRISAVFEDGEHWKGTDNGDGNSATNGTITLIR